MARVISEKTFNAITKLLNNAIKSAKDPKIKSHFNELLEDLDNSDKAIGYDDE